MPNKHTPFWFGGSASCMAALCTHPLDLLKVRLQTAVGARSAGLAGTAINIVKHEGIMGMYSGLSASLLRQVTYSTMRFGAYDALKEMVVVPDGGQPGFGMLICMSFGAGWIGGVAGNPADIINVRMQQDLANPPDKRRNYKHAIDGLIRVVRDEGAAALFRGVWPNTLRAGLMTSSQLATYDEAKVLLLKTSHFEDGIITHFTASLISGLVATTICSPVDVIKTRIMTSHDTHGILHLLGDITRKEGLSWAFKGWLPSFMRLGPHTIITFIALEQHRKIWRWLHEDKQQKQKAI